MTIIQIVNMISMMMEVLQELNPDKETATNAMCTFLAINTSSVQLILPATVVALMGAAANPVSYTHLTLPTKA